MRHLRVLGRAVGDRVIDVPDDVLLQMWRTARSFAESLRKLAVFRGLVVCERCGEKHTGACPNPTASR